MKRTSFRILLLTVGMAVAILFSSCEQNELRQRENEINQTAGQTKDVSPPEDNIPVSDPEPPSGTEQTAEPQSFEAPTADIGNLTGGWTPEFR